MLPMTDDRPDTVVDPAVDPLAVLQAREAAAREARDQALAELRATVSDQDLLQEYGIDVTRAD